MILPPHVPRLHVRLVVLQDGHPVPFLHVAINFGPDIVIQSLYQPVSHIVNSVADANLIAKLNCVFHLVCV